MKCASFLPSVLIAGLIIFVTACGGYKGKSNPQSPEELKTTDMAEELENQSEKLQQDAPDPLRQAMTDFADAAARFHNACGRFGSNALEAHNAFDKVMFETAKLQELVTAESFPEFFGRWEKLRKESVLPLAHRLGYKPEEH